MTFFIMIKRRYGTLCIRITRVLLAVVCFIIVSVFVNSYMLCPVCSDQTRQNHPSDQTRQNHQSKSTTTSYKTYDKVGYINYQHNQYASLNNVRYLASKEHRKKEFNYKAAMRKLNRRRVASDDPRLIELIRHYYIWPPSMKDYNLTHPDIIDPSEGQAPFVDSRLKYKAGGFFVECGGLDGERASNTLLLERYRGWSGLLIEADPINFEKLVAKHRKAFAINACLNTKPYPSTVTFNQAEHVGRIAEGEGQGQTTKVQCFPLYSILLALNQTDVDFFSLDIEGDELKVLETIPFDKVNITMMAVEYRHQSAGAATLRNFVEMKGYETLIQMSKHTDWVNDLIFRQKGMSN